MKFPTIFTDASAPAGERPYRPKVDQEIGVVPDDRCLCGYWLGASPDKTCSGCGAKLSFLSSFSTSKNSQLFAAGAVTSGLLSVATLVMAMNGSSMWWLPILATAGVVGVSAACMDSKAPEEDAEAAGGLLGIIQSEAFQLVALEKKTERVKSIAAQLRESGGQENSEELARESLRALERSREEHARLMHTAQLHLLANRLSYLRSLAPEALDQPEIKQSIERAFDNLSTLRQQVGASGHFPEPSKAKMLAKVDAHRAALDQFRRRMLEGRLLREAADIQGIPQVSTVMSEPVLNIENELPPLIELEQAYARLRGENLIEEEFRIPE